MGEHKITWSLERGFHMVEQKMPEQWSAALAREAKVRLRWYDIQAGRAIRGDSMHWHKDALDSERVRSKMLEESRNFLWNKCRNMEISAKWWQESAETWRERCLARLKEIDTLQESLAVAERDLKIVSQTAEENRDTIESLNAQRNEIIDENIKLVEERRDCEETAKDYLEDVQVTLAERDHAIKERDESRKACEVWRVACRQAEELAESRKKALDQALTTIAAQQGDVTWARLQRNAAAGTTIGVTKQLETQKRRCEVLSKAIDDIGTIVAELS